MSKSAVELLAATHPDLEIWWDSSPLVYAEWRDDLLQASHEGSRDELASQLQRLYNEQQPERSLLGGATTNPPLSWRVIDGR